jgi:hypothetical protein
MSEAFRKRTRTERFWEVLPGIMFWGTMILAILMAKYQPLWTSIFIICFDLYWVLKALNVATHLLASYLVFCQILFGSGLKKLKAVVFLLLACKKNEIQKLP